MSLFAGVLRWAIVASVLAYGLWAWEYDMAPFLLGIVAGSFLANEISYLRISNAAYYALGAAVGTVFAVVILLPFSGELAVGFAVGAGAFAPLRMLLDRREEQGRRVD